MTKKNILEHFKSLGIDVAEITLLVPRVNWYRIIINQAMLNDALAKKIVNMPCFVQFGVTWGGAVPRFVIYINRNKNLE